MRIALIVSLLCCTSQLTYSQDVQSALFLYDNFEFAKAIEAFEVASKTDKLKFENSEKLAYCYYITGNHIDGLPFIDSLMAKDNSGAHFWLWKGTLEKESGLFDNAIASLEGFKTRSSELNVDVLIESCKLIPTWKDYEFMTASESGSNDSKANSFGAIKENELFFFEAGRDSVLNDLSVATSSSEFSQLLVMRPYRLIGETYAEIPLFDNYKNISISAIQFNESDNKIYFTASDPLNRKAILQAPQIYTASFTSLETPVTDVEIWEHSGMKDSSSCSHPTLSFDGSTMVYSKSSKMTKGSDLFLSQFENGNWSEPIALSGINTTGNEMFPNFQGDSLLTFSSDGRPGYGGLDLYSVEVKNLSTENVPRHYKAPVNSAMDDFKFSWKDSLNAQIVSNRINGSGDDDVWNLNIDRPIEPVIDVIDYDFITWREKWNLKQIYFDFDSFESEVNQEFISGYKKYHEKYGVSIELVGHTDSRGPKVYNYKLGKNRADWLKDQLIKAEIGDEITTDSVGETELVNNCMAGVICSEKDHRLNRFVQIKLSTSQE